MNSHCLTLDAICLATHEAYFARLVARVFPHISYSLYFPSQIPQLQWLARERSLVLPLVRGEVFLGVFIARGVDARLAKRLLPSAPVLIALCLDALENALRSRTDPLTGLALPHVLLARLCDEAENIRADFDGTPPLHRLCVGLVLVHWPQRRNFAVEHGHIFTDALTRALAAALREFAPPDALLARTAENEFALLLPSATRTSCRKVADALVPKLEAVRLPHPVTHTHLSPQCMVLWAAYPQDIPSKSFALPMEEQGSMLLEAARSLQVFTAEGDGKELDAVSSVPSLTGLDAAALHRLLHRHSAFTLAILHSPLLQMPSPHASSLRVPEQIRDMCCAVPCLAEFFCEGHIVRVHENGKNGESRERVGSRQGRGMRTDAALERAYTDMCACAAGQGLIFAVGLATYPVLRCHKDEIIHCAHKALELARLLPAPHIGVFGSLALNISADKLYSAGDTFAALEEYRRALLFDARNALAWSSLGVCLADISQPLEARHAFLRANALVPNNIATLYNLGSVCQGLGSNRSAAHWYRRCVGVASPATPVAPAPLSPVSSHGIDTWHNLAQVSPVLAENSASGAVAYQAFALIRLGQLAEKGGRRALARQYYQRAAVPVSDTDTLDTGMGTGMSMALRHLARLDSKRDPDAARAHLHDALRHNPNDALALEMLAGLYLVGVADPAMAEMLARKSVVLRPTHTVAWDVLGKALRTQGKEAEAREAQART